MYGEVCLKLTRRKKDGMTNRYQRTKKKELKRRRQIAWMRKEGRNKLRKETIEKKEAKEKGEE